MPHSPLCLISTIPSNSFLPWTSRTEPSGALAPTLADTDGVGLDDGAEVCLLGTSVSLADTDGDGVDDAVEVWALTDPTRP